MNEFPFDWIWRDLLGLILLFFYGCWQYWNVFLIYTKGKHHFELKTNICEIPFEMCCDSKRKKIGYEHQNSIDLSNTFALKCKYVIVE